MNRRLELKLSYLYSNSSLVISTPTQAQLSLLQLKLSYLHSNSSSVICTPTQAHLSLLQLKRLVGRQQRAMQCHSALSGRGSCRRQLLRLCSPALLPCSCFLESAESKTQNSVKHVIYKNMGHFVK